MIKNLGNQIRHVALHLLNALQETAELVGGDEVLLHFRRQLVRVQEVAHVGLGRAALAPLATVV